MAKVRKILARRKAVRSIRAVARTMEMVATARFKRTFHRCLSARGYIDGMGELTDEVLTKTHPKDLHHPLLEVCSPAGPRLLLVLTSDRGLCGGYNAAVLQRAGSRRDELLRVGTSVRLHVVGRVGLSEWKSAGVEVEKAYREFDPTGPTGWRNVSSLADAWMTEFLGGTLSGVEVAYSALIGSAKYQPIVETLLPLVVKKRREEETWPEESSPLEDSDPSAPLRPLPPLEPYPPLPRPEFEYEFVPSLAELFRRLLPMTYRLRLFQCFLEAAVTEQLARMTAMRAAADSAEEMIRDLTIQYNRTRQGQITTELAEILGGRMAVQ